MIKNTYPKTSGTANHEVKSLLTLRQSCPVLGGHFSIHHKNVSMKFKLAGLKLAERGNTPENGDERCDNDEETEDEEVCGKTRIASSA